MDDREGVTPDPEVGIVAAWHEALNGGGVERLVALSHPDIEMGGPREGGRGAQVLREWVARAGVSLEPRRVFHRADLVVVEQGAAWRDAETGEVTGSRAVGSVFVVRDGRIASVVRHPTLADALRAADLDESHETPLG